MNLLSLLLRLYRFLGSLSFTFILFSFIILVVCVGTFLESLTESHRFAESWTYGHPLFFIVFLSLFANILFSATRRWPFQKRHIPFLITHLGLLLLLTGVWIKGAFGLQGHMNLLEGNGSHHVILPHQQMVRLINRQGMVQEWHIAHTLFGAHAHALNPQRAGQLGELGEPNMTLTLLDIHPHGRQQFQLWNQEEGYINPYDMDPIAAEELQQRASVYAVEKGFGGYFLHVPLSPPGSPLGSSQDSLSGSPPDFTSLYYQICPYVERLPPLTKREEETPVLRFRIAKQAQEELIELVYDATQQGLKLPVLGGAYLAHCIPYATEIPYHIRLRDTQKIVYPDSDQAASYEAECLITDRHTGEAEEVRLSMNRVHETADGHRFYLASLSPGHEESERLKQVRLVVSRDPLRSLLTYLGGCFVAIGILLLARATLFTSSHK